MFDFTPLTTARLLLLLAALIGTSILIRALLKTHPRWLQAAGPPYFAGSLIAAVVFLLGFAVLPFQLALGLSLAGLLILLIGRQDELRSLSPRRQLFWQIIIAVLVVSFGWTIPHISHPFNSGIISLAWGGGLLAAIWILLLMNAINWLDGSDGLAGTVSLAGFITLAAISLLPQTQDGTTLSLALIGIGATLGFLIWNVPPARVYLGTTGSWFLGLYLAATAIIGGGKIATALLVLSLPILDLLAVIFQRWRKRQAIWQGDTQHHLHYRLRSLGLPPVFIATLLGGASLSLGLLGIVLQTRQKIVALIVVALLFAGGVLWIVRKSKLTKMYGPSRP